MRRGRSKLEDCERHGPGSGSELLVVEGDSAALAVCQARDPRVQAVLPMQGKPMNALKATDGKVATNPFLRALTEAIGTGRGAAFDRSALRYERVVLLMDPDADGIHCGALLLMFFHRWMPVLLENGHLERVHAPVGEVRRAEGGAPAYAYTDAQFKTIGARLRANGATAFTALRYRGLAGLDRPVLAETCVRRETRNGRLLGPADAQAAMEVFASLRELPPQGALF
jgi:DNA gyrase subunit B/topoisomerase-4 subunit B